MPVSPSEQTEARLLRIFSDSDLAEARTLLEVDRGHNVSGWRLTGLERFRAAVLKTSGGSIAGLIESIVVAQTDVRDVPMNAGFEHDPSAHKDWWP